MGMKTKNNIKSERSRETSSYEIKLFNLDHVKTDLIDNTKTLRSRLDKQFNKALDNMKQDGIDCTFTKTLLKYKSEYLDIFSEHLSAANILAPEEHTIAEIYNFERAFLLNIMTPLKKLRRLHQKSEKQLDNEILNTSSCSLATEIFKATRKELSDGIRFFGEEVFTDLYLYKITKKQIPTLR